jgi:hypothetical protein
MKMVRLPAKAVARAQGLARRLDGRNSSWRQRDAFDRILGYRVRKSGAAVLSRAVEIGLVQLEVEVSEILESG